MKKKITKRNEMIDRIQYLQVDNNDYEFHVGERAIMLENGPTKDELSYVSVVLRNTWTRTRYYEDRLSQFAIHVVSQEPEEEHTNAANIYEFLYEQQNNLYRHGFRVEEAVFSFSNITAIPRDVADNMKITCQGHKYNYSGNGKYELDGIISKYNGQYNHFSLKFRGKKYYFVFNESEDKITSTLDDFEDVALQASFRACYMEKGDKLGYKVTLGRHREIVDSLFLVQGRIYSVPARRQVVVMVRDRIVYLRHGQSFNADLEDGNYFYDLDAGFVMLQTRQSPTGIDQWLKIKEGMTSEDFHYVNSEEVQIDKKKYLGQQTNSISIPIQPRRLLRRSCQIVGIDQDGAITQCQQHSLSFMRIIIKETEYVRMRFSMRDI